MIRNFGAKLIGKRGFLCRLTYVQNRALYFFGSSCFGSGFGTGNLYYAADDG